MVKPPAFSLGKMRKDGAPRVSPHDPTSRWVAWTSKLILRGDRCQIGSCASLYSQTPTSSQPFAVIEPYIYGFSDDSLTGLVHALGTVQQRTKYSPSPRSEDLLLALAALAPERARAALASISLRPLPAGARPEPMRTKDRAADPLRAAESQLNRFFLALSDKTRRNILRLLETRAYCATEIESHFESSQPTISRHLRALKRASLVTHRREGRHVLYRLSGDKLARSMNQFFSEF